MRQFDALQSRARIGESAFKQRRFRQSQSLLDNRGKFCLHGLVTGRDLRCREVEFDRVTPRRVINLASVRGESCFL